MATLERTGSLMAHCCPECGSTCYCNGDIDDCVFDEDAEQEAACTCCIGKTLGDEGLGDDYYLDGYEGAE